MIVYDLNNNKELHFSHNNVLVAIAHAVYDRQTNIRYNVKDIAKKLVIKKGKYGWHSQNILGLSVPFSSVKNPVFDMPKY